MTRPADTVKSLIAGNKDSLILTTFFNETANQRLQMVKDYPFQQRCLMASVYLNVYSVDMFTYSTDRNDYFIVLPITWLHVRSCIVMYFVDLSNLFPFSWPYKHEFVMFSPTFPQTPFKDLFCTSHCKWWDLIPKDGSSCQSRPSQSPIHFIPSICCAFGFIICSLSVVSTQNESQPANTTTISKQLWKNRTGWKKLQWRLRFCK